MNTPLRKHRRGNGFIPLKPQRLAAFTLIELMLVLVIMATFAGMIMPAMSRALRETSLQTTGERFCEVLNFAYLSAVSRKRTVVVNFDAARGLCWVSLQTLSLPWLPEEDQTKTRTLASMELPERTEIIINRLGETAPQRVAAEEWETVTFRSDGRTDDLLIELIDESGESLEVEVIGATGEVRIREES
jgi:Tfp pilus assembly protein FimT